MVRQQKEESRRRILMSAGIFLFVIVVMGGIFLLVNRSNDDDTSAASTSTTLDSMTSSTLAAVESAAGKPCVPLADPLPEGAPDVPITEGPPPTELVTEDLVVGTGDPVPADATVTVDYIGVSCSTGTIFDDSYTRGQPATFPLSGVIPGWTAGIPGMQVGGQRLLVIPPDQAYGPSGQGDIAPDETLYFVVNVKKADPPPVSTTTAG